MSVPTEKLLLEVKLNVEPVTWGTDDAKKKKAQGNNKKGDSRI